MRQIVIIGNSGAARECYWILQEMLHADAALAEDCVFKGFLSWRGYPDNLKDLCRLSLGEATEYAISPDDRFVIGIGLPALRRDVFCYFKARGAVFFTLQHPRSCINPTARIGEANIVQEGCTVFCDTRIGDANYLNGAVNIAHDVSVGDYNFLGPYTLLLGGSRMGDANSLAVRCTVLPGARIGNGNLIAPCSVVYKGCGDNMRMAGNPALKVAPYAPVEHQTRDTRA